MNFVQRSLAQAVPKSVGLNDSMIPKGIDLPDSTTELVSQTSGADKIDR